MKISVLFVGTSLTVVGTASNFSSYTFTGLTIGGIYYVIISNIGGGYSFTGATATFVARFDTGPEGHGNYASVALYSLDVTATSVTITKTSGTSPGAMLLEL